jgi:hypothetical protein
MPLEKIKLSPFPLVDRLKPGRAFELYEGKKKVATVEIVA